MGSLTDYAEDALLDHAFKNTSFTVPTNLYVGLSTTTITDAGGNITEPADTYARQNHNSWNAASSRLADNNGTVTFPQATASWGTITDWFLADALTGGNILAYGALTASRTVGDGDQLEFASGAIDISFNSGGFFNYLAHELLDHMLKTGAFTQPTNLYVALSTTDWSDDGTGGTEPVGNGYARLNHNDFSPDASAGAIDNASAVTFAAASGGNWGTIIAFAIYDALTGGNPFAYAGMDADKAVNDGDVAEFAAGDLNITLA
jgi:hypothetical protein